jgi:hypothetical protein
MEEQQSSPNVAAMLAALPEGAGCGSIYDGSGWEEPFGEAALHDLCGPNLSQQVHSRRQQAPKQRRNAPPKNREGWQVSLCASTVICYPKALPPKDAFAQRKVPRPVSPEASRGNSRRASEDNGVAVDRGSPGEEEMRTRSKELSELKGCESAAPGASSSSPGPCCVAEPPAVLTGSPFPGRHTIGVIGAGAATVPAPAAPGRRSLGAARGAKQEDSRRLGR